MQTIPCTGEGRYIGTNDAIAALRLEFADMTHPYFIARPMPVEAVRG